ncbi:ABC transporter substrate-binding protein [Geomicrobium sp. JCM 19055]|uniref:ABC transporter substrate-binding protein n=1 Tax=Geomicrobium sp. JCM 19055 TaxID=1460649 RepID=UPI00045ED0C8|nr:ABC transporter substrate-binding protein [Geomicrobium sp. JCM 19055]GAK00555.1 dipeptide-binding ABC transporter, periplasmic substrate-binding component [Geomicrobium sp. JCM 19055]
MFHNKSKAGIFFLLLVLFGCSSDGADSGETADMSTEINSEELRVALGALPPVLDSHMSMDTNGSIIGRNIFETLVTFDSNFTVQPMLAESWEQNDDGTTFTFNLRENVQFHNGKEMIAEDVVASLERWIAVSTTGIDTFPEGTTLSSEGDHTVIMELPTPVSTILETLAYSGANFASIMPKEVIDEEDTTGVDTYIGTGPYKLEEWTQDQYIHLSAYENYESVAGESDGLSGERNTIIDNLYFMDVTDPATREAGVETGEYDVAFDISYDSAERLGTVPHLNVNAHPFGMYVLTYNKDTGLFADERAREAISLAISKEGILQAAFTSEDYYTLDHSLMSGDQSELWSSDVGEQEYYEHNPEKAKQLLTDAGYTGEEITILASREHGYYYNGSVVLQQQLEQLGLNINLEIVEWSAYLELRADPANWDLYLGASTPRISPTSLGFLRSEQPGWTNSSELDQLVDEFNVATPDEAEELYEELQAWFYEYKPVTKIADFSKVYASNENVNYEFQDGPIFWDTSITE